MVVTVDADLAVEGAQLGNDAHVDRVGKAFYQLVLDELLEERVVSSRGRRRPRGVKRKMSGYPLRPRDPVRNERTQVKIVIIPP